MKNRTFVIFISFVFAFGATVGHRLSILPRLEMSKLMNIAGLSYDFLGVIVLSEMVSSSVRWRRVAVTNIAPVVLWFHTVFPLGALGGALLSRGPSSGTASTFAIAFWSYSLIPLGFLNEVVVFPRSWAGIGIELRWRFFGLLLVVSGIGLQLVAAVARV